MTFLPNVSAQNPSDWYKECVSNFFLKKKQTRRSSTAARKSNFSWLRVPVGFYVGISMVSTLMVSQVNLDIICNIIFERHE